MKCGDIEALRSYGFDAWLQSRAQALSIEGLRWARVIAVHKDRYLVTSGRASADAELSGRLAYTAQSPSDFPTTGDWVIVDFYDDDSHAIIHQLGPRQSLLKRKAAGKLVDYQLIAANIDTAFIVQPLDQGFNLNRLERYLVLVNESDIDPVLLLSKSDLVSAAELENRIEEIHLINPQLSIIPCSNFSETGIDAIREIMLPGKSYCLLGSSGVGKTSLMNSLLGGERFDTAEVRGKDSKGRHTTTHRELVKLDFGALLIDTPGMRELGNLSVDKGIDETYAEITELAQQCRFGNCSHRNEKGCAVLAAVDQGLLDRDRLQNYDKLKKESDFNEMSYAEKRRKDKKFGKLIRNTLKSKNR